MPPPSFSNSAAVAAATQHQHTQAGHAAPSINDLPKAQRGIVRDVIQCIRASLVSSNATKPAPVAKSSAAAYQAIQRLVAEPGIERQAEVGTTAGLTSSNMTAIPSANGGSTAHPSTRRGADDHRANGSGGAVSNGDTAAPSLRAQISALLEIALFDIFSDEMDQGSSPKCQLLVSYLFVLRPILDPLCVVREWWDVLLRPVLKDPRCHPEIARRAQQLVIWTMACTPVEAYTDEAPPSAVWPPTEQSALAAEDAQSRRKPGAAPYPLASTRSVSPGRSSQSSDARRSTLFSAVKRSKDTRHPLWRFTHRIFDMYTAEASSASIKSIEDDDIKDVDEDELALQEHGIDQNESIDLSASLKGDSPAHNVSSETGPTWKGNLEAIILAFGEERPKAFFHHLSEAFMDPQARIPILLLITIFFRISSLHAYHVVSTPFVRLLVLSLQLDTSKLSAALGVYALATLIPHIPNWIANGGAGGLPALLSILARVIDWRKLGQRWEERSIAVEGDGMEEINSLERISRRLRVREDIKWDRLDTRSDNAANPAPPDAELLFTFLYGIFPCNVIRFLRGPLNYLRRAEYESPFEMDWEDIIDEEAIQHKCAPILRRHILHPSLVDMDAEREISDKQRWRDHDAADITAECVCLNVKQASIAYALAPGDQPSAFDALSSAPVRQSRFDASEMASRKQNDSVGIIPSQQLQQNFLTAELFPTPEASPVARRRANSDTLGTSTRPVITQELTSQGVGLSSLARPATVLMREQATHGDFGPAFSAAHHSSRRGSASTEVDGLLQNHIRLRYGISHGSPLGGSTPNGESLSRSSSARSRGTRSPSVSRSDQRAAGAPAQSVTQMSAEAGLRALANRSVSTGSSLVSTAPAFGAEAGKRKRMVLKDEVVQSIAYLKQENLQLRNELNYEIGQKDQMLRHIGRVHRDRIKETARDDERQNLYQLVRALRGQLKTVRESAERSKAEALSFKSRHSRWEDELNVKVKQFREERRIWTNEVRQLQIAKEDREALIAKLEKQLHENADEVFEMRQQCKRDADKIKAIHAYEDKCKRLEACLELWDDDMRKFEAQEREAVAYAHRCEELSMLLEAGDEERRKAESAARAAEFKCQALSRDLQTANETIKRLQATQERAFEAAARDQAGALKRTSALSASLDTDVSPSSPGLPSASDRETIRSRTRLERLEAEVLDLRAKNEQWQMQTLLDKLQAERSSTVSVPPLPAVPDLAESVTKLDLGDAIEQPPEVEADGESSSSPAAIPEADERKHHEDRP